MAAERGRQLEALGEAQLLGAGFRFFPPIGDSELLRYRLPNATAAARHLEPAVWPTVQMTIEDTAVSYIKLRVLRCGRSIAALPPANQMMIDDAARGTHRIRDTHNQTHSEQN